MGAGAESLIGSAQELSNQTNGTDPRVDSVRVMSTVRSEKKWVITVAETLSAGSLDDGHHRMGDEEV